MKSDAKPIGAPRLVISDSQRREVQRLSGFGTPTREISVIIGISIGSLYKYHREDMILGRARANTKVVNALYDAAIEGNVKAQMYWTKHRCGWVEGKDTSEEYEPDKSRIQLVTNHLVSVRRDNDQTD